MSQISMPMRILLVGAAVFLAAWFTVLKPGGAEPELPPVQPANATPPAGSATAAATPGAGAATANTPVADVEIPADVLAKLPEDVAAAIEARKTLVLGVFADTASNWRPMADDDRYVRNALEKVNRYDGAVLVKRIGLDELSTYAPLVNDLGVAQSPAVVVIDGDLKGTALTGYVDRIAINQAIADARRSSIDPAIEDAYLRWTNTSCENYEVRRTRWSLPTIPGQKAELQALRRLQAMVGDYVAAIERKPAPAEHKRFKAARIADLDMRRRALDTAIAAHRAGRSAEAAMARGIDNDVAGTADAYFNDLGLTACAADRRS